MDSNPQYYAITRKRTTSCLASSAARLQGALYCSVSSIFYYAFNLPNFILKSGHHASCCLHLYKQSTYFLYLPVTITGLSNNRFTSLKTNCCLYFYAFTISFRRTKYLEKKLRKCGFPNIFISPNGVLWQVIFFISYFSS